MPFTSVDIAHELNRASDDYFKAAGIKEKTLERKKTQEHVRRALVDLEEDGLCERRVNGKPLQKITKSDLQSAFKGTIEIYCWLLPHMPAEERIQKQWQEAKDAETDRRQVAFKFSPVKIFKSLGVPVDPDRLEESIVSAREQFERAVNSIREKFSYTFTDSKDDTSKNLTETSPNFPPITGGANQHTSTPPGRGASTPPGRGGSSLLTEKIVENIEEKKTSSTSLPSPPKVATDSDRRMRRPPQSEQKHYPLTLAELRQRDPATTEKFVHRLVDAILDYCTPRVSANDLAKIDIDQTIAAMCIESFATGPRNHGVGLLLSRVPAIAVTWCQGDDDAEENRHSA